MSDPIDIKALEEYLKGGSDISQRYRELGRDDVPPEIDRRVLDEARAAVAGGAARSRSWLRWSAPVALAASVVLVVAVVIESPVQDGAIAIQAPSEVSYEETAQARQPQPEPQLQNFVREQPAAPAPSAAQPAAPPPPVASVAKSERKRAENAAVVEEVVATAPAARQESFASSPLAVTTVTAVQSAPPRTEDDRAPGVVADSSARADDASQLQEVVISGNRQRRPQGRTAGPRNTISGSAFSSEARPAADADVEQTDPEQWLEEIRELRRAGKAAQADRAWEQFRKAFPDFVVADDDFARRQP